MAQIVREFLQEIDVEFRIVHDDIVASGFRRALYRLMADHKELHFVGVRYMLVNYGAWLHIIKIPVITRLCHREEACVMSLDNNNACQLYINFLKWKIADQDCAIKLYVPICVTSFLKALRMAVSSTRVIMGN